MPCVVHLGLHYADHSCTLELVSPTVATKAFVYFGMHVTEDDHTWSELVIYSSRSNHAVAVATYLLGLKG